MHADPTRIRTKFRDVADDCMEPVPLAYAALLLFDEVTARVWNVDRAVCFRVISRERELHLHGL